ncbi:DegT/DnrJ/EryC1/StrS family aminotransferase [Parasphaerochaeta coccoides]|uniref:DegT/DnrJ/EryC1/StrS aminotransferase n=1 Tax=Parasphaerochaeta coccoides (strain ATCC BAA-1237 / DSM 17374 / SPN1) TaxID=760011 RepID=F4GKX7_PARC1|nr:DegT/DnrJ/EryC1/StrS family aminotransferase [Parasphaerochaeta coccoides]AEC01890.1 DegT/DnrJ/EryC1/StrS aminotransferase [Parasphaerochaeta coccoides DSM 17374]
MALIRFSKPTLRRSDMTAVLQTMVDEKIGPGERKKEFVRLFSTLIDQSESRGMALRSYPDALSVALQTLGAGEGSIIATSVLSPGVYARVASMLGATLVLGDIDPTTGCISLAEATRLAGEGAQILLLHEPSGTLPFEADYTTCGMKIVEDITESLGSKFEELIPGAQGDVIVCACEECNIVSTGGGAVCILAKKSKMTSFPDDILGSDLAFIEMPDMNAALGIVQIETFDLQVKRRMELYRQFKKSLMKTPHKVFGIKDIAFDANGHDFTVLLDSKPEDVAKFAAKYGISTLNPFDGCVGSAFTDRFDIFPHGIPMILRGMSFPIYPFLKSDDIETLNRVISHLP